MHEDNVEQIQNRPAKNKPIWIMIVLIVVAAAVLLAVTATSNRASLSVEGCEGGYVYNIKTGEACPKEIANDTPEGCEGGVKFSKLSGLSCDGKPPGPGAE